MRVGTLGSGLMGAKIGTLCARAGVTFSYARSTDKLARLVREAGGNARFGTPAEAAVGADALSLPRNLHAWCPGRLSSRPFGTIPSEVLFGVFAARGRGTPPSLLYCGDDARAKQVAAALIRDLGFDPVDAGALAAARYLEPFTMLMALLAYEGDGGPELAYRFEHIG